MHKRIIGLGSVLLYNNKLLHYQFNIFRTLITKMKDESVDGCVNSFKQRQHFSRRVKDVKPSVWVEFTSLAVECKAVNIGPVNEYFN